MTELMAVYLCGTSGASLWGIPSGQCRGDKSTLSQGLCCCGTAALRTTLFMLKGNTKILLSLVAKK